MAFSASYETTNPGAAVGNREDLSDVAYVLEPMETPLMSLAARSKATATNPEWTVDELQDPSTGAAGVPEGRDVPSFDDQFATKEKLSSHVQKFEAPWQVTDIQNAVTSAGGAHATTVAGAKTKSIQNLKRFVEYAFGSDNDHQAESASAAALLRGLGDWIDSAGPSDVGAPYRTPSASIDANGASIDESQFNAVLQSMFQNTGYSGGITFLAAPALRAQISSFGKIDLGATSQRYHVNEDAGKRQITFSVVVFESDFGTVNIANLNPACEPTATGSRDRGYFIPPGLLKAKELIPIESRDLEDKGGGQRGFCKCAISLCPGNPKGFGKVS